MRKKLVPFLIGLPLAAALGLTRVSADTPDIGQNSPAMWRAWRPLVTAFGSGDADTAVNYLKQASIIVRKADAKLNRDKTTEDFRTSAIKKMKSSAASRSWASPAAPPTTSRRPIPTHPRSSTARAISSSVTPMAT
jgi:hypothetical protein